jgi:hypothetical protein
MAENSQGLPLRFLRCLGFLFFVQRSSRQIVAPLSISGEVHGTRWQNSVVLCRGATAKTNGEPKGVEGAHGVSHLNCVRCPTTENLKNFHPQFRQGELLHQGF